MAAAAACAGCLSLVMMGGTVSAAVKPAALALSDTAKFTGMVTPGAMAGTFNFNSTTCTLTSDLESAVSCMLTGTITVPAAGGNPTGTFTLTSLDGQTQGTFTLTPGTTAGSYLVKGTCMENDAPEPGQPPGPYPAVVRGKVLINFAAMTMKGTVVVKEKSTGVP